MKQYIAATAATSEAKYIQALFLACGQHVNIHLRSDGAGAIGVASRRSLQRLRHLDVRFLWLQAESASKNIRNSKVLGPENVADANTKTCRQTFARVLSIEGARHRDPDTVS